MSLFPGDLKNLVKPKISIDEYEPKIDEDAIVVAFYVNGEDPAYDLSQFIEFGAVDILDTEVSPVPNKDNLYLLFVEIDSNRFARKLIDILKSVNYITDNGDWLYSAYGKDMGDKISL